MRSGPGSRPLRAAAAFELRPARRPLPLVPSLPGGPRPCGHSEEPRAVAAAASSDNVSAAGHNGVMTELAWVTLSTPVGPLSAGCSEAGVSQVRFGGPLRPGSPPGAAPGPARDLSGVVLAQLTEYFSGQRRRFDLPV